MHQQINRITDILRRDDGISGAMHYTEQISWILFLKFLSDYERNKAFDAELDGKTYKWLLELPYRWEQWACPKTADNKPDLKNALTGSDLIGFVNDRLFPYLKSFRDSHAGNPKTIEYKIGGIFEVITNRIQNGGNLREVLNIVDALEFQNNSDLFELSKIYEDLLKGMGSDGGNSGEFYTPRPLIKTMVEVVRPEIGQRIYDPASGTCGFLIEAFEYIKKGNTDAQGNLRLSGEQTRFLQSESLSGVEKTPLSYAMGVMNMILHGVEAPNIRKENTLNRDIRQIQESERYDVILANPPFGGKENESIQSNFPIESNATELLFLQHILKSVRAGGKIGIVLPEGVLFQTNNAFTRVKQLMLEDFNLHTIVSLPAGVFLPYSGVKTNVLFLEKTGSTRQIWYYEVNPPYKLTKNKPIQYEHFEEFLRLLPEKAASDNSWTLSINQIENYDLSAKNPNKTSKEVLPTPAELLSAIEADDQKIQAALADLREVLGRKIF
ncbi:MAG: N-6 DNA methylase [Chitinophagales bacterium]|nr:N-6 DNA methylase [Chitinophagales bacterium]